jgi:DNA-binding NarL/FixJ family response regulator
MTPIPDDRHMSRRLLIVDDVQQVRTELLTLLSLVGNIEIVGQATNGLEAVNQVESLQPDVVLMDLEMPGMNGYEAARQIKKHSPATRVIALTVHDYSAARERASLFGADAFIVKGSSLESLVQEILKKE